MLRPCGIQSRGHCALKITCVVVVVQDVVFHTRDIVKTLIITSYDVCEDAIHSSNIRYHLMLRLAYIAKRVSIKISNSETYGRMPTAGGRHD